MSAPVLADREIKSLKQLIGNDYVSTGRIDRINYSYDQMGRSAIQRRNRLPSRLPQAVVRPGDTKQVSDLVRWCSRRRIPLIAYGGGSGMSGGVQPMHGGIMVDLQRMNRVEGIKPAQRTAVVQCGIFMEKLEADLQKQGYTQGHFPGSMSMATLGGSIATRGVGQLSTRYGGIADIVEAVEVVLPSGAILPMSAKQIPKLPGPSPHSLFLGSEGTLGIVTRARLRLHPKPQASFIRAFSFVKLGEALKAVRRIMQTGLNPSIVRLYDPMESLLINWRYEHRLQGKLGYVLEALARPLMAPALRMMRPFKEQAKDQVRELALDQILSHPRISDFLMRRLPTNCVLVLGFEGDEKFMAAQEKEAQRICRGLLCRDEGRDMGKHWLDHRFSSGYKTPLLFSEGDFVDSIEVAASWDRVDELYQDIREAVAKHCLVMTHFAHPSAQGCSIYFTFVGTESNPAAQLKLYDRVWNEAMNICLNMGGTISHHNGVGILKGKYMARELGDLMELFRHYKTTLDPHDIMNPGKMGLRTAKGSS